MRGISATIAHVLLIAVTVAISLAVISWVASISGSTQSSKALIIVYPDSYINVSDVDFTLKSAVGLHLHLAVRSDKGVRVDHIEVLETGDRVYYFYLTGDDMTVRRAYEESRGIVHREIPGAWEGWLIASLYVRSPLGGDEGPYTAGSTYTIRIYLKDGSFYEALVPARS